MSADEIHMQRALELARYQHGRTGENPAVGCVLTDRSGKVISEGATGDGGRPHAEQVALHRLDSAATQGGTAYVTLEPCGTRSTGEPACSQRLITAGFARVVFATPDRHPLGTGGAKRLQAAGITVEVGLLSAEADALYADFFAGL